MAASLSLPWMGVQARGAPIPLRRGGVSRLSLDEAAVAVDADSYRD